MSAKPRVSFNLGVQPDEGESEMPPAPKPALRRVNAQSTQAFQDTLDKVAENGEGNSDDGENDEQPEGGEVAEGENEQPPCGQADQTEVPESASSSDLDELLFRGGLKDPRDLVYFIWESVRSEHKLYLEQAQARREAADHRSRVRSRARNVEVGLARIARQEQAWVELYDLYCEREMAMNPQEWQEEDSEKESGSENPEDSVGSEDRPPGMDDETESSEEAY